MNALHTPQITYGENWGYPVLRPPICVIISKLQKLRRTVPLSLGRGYDSTYAMELLYESHEKMSRTYLAQVPDSQCWLSSLWSLAEDMKGCGVNLGNKLPNRKRTKRVNRLSRVIRAPADTGPDWLSGIKQSCAAQESQDPRFRSSRGSVTV